jgi:hypothetical protein
MQYLWLKLSFVKSIPAPTREETTTTISAKSALSFHDPDPSLNEIDTV